MAPPYTAGATFETGSWQRYSIKTPVETVHSKLWILPPETVRVSAAVISKGGESRRAIADLYDAINGEEDLRLAAMSEDLANSK